MEIQIRKMIPEDFKPLFKLLSNPEVMKYLENPFTMEQTKKFMEEEGLCNSPRIYSAILDKQFIGYVIYHPYDNLSNEIGWVLLPEYYGKGYASLLTQILIEKAKKDRKNLIIECVPEQIASKRIAEKFGFSYNGRSEGLDIYTLRV